MFLEHPVGAQHVPLLQQFFLLQQLLEGTQSFFAQQFTTIQHFLAEQLFVFLQQLAFTGASANSGEGFLVAQQSPSGQHSPALQQHAPSAWHVDEGVHLQSEQEHFLIVFEQQSAEFSSVSESVSSALQQSPSGQQVPSLQQHSPVVWHSEIAAQLQSEQEHFCAGFAQQATTVSS